MTRQRNQDFRSDEKSHIDCLDSVRSDFFNGPLRTSVPFGRYPVSQGIQKGSKFQKYLGREADAAILDRTMINATFGRATRNMILQKKFLYQLYSKILVRIRRQPFHLILL